MDSRLLNAIFDDPFDGNFVKYDNGTGFWPSNSETMGMQLTETLNGILPLTPSEDLHNEEFTNSKNVYNYGDYAGENMLDEGEFEIITLDSNADGYVSDSEDNNEDDDLIDFELQSQSSDCSFYSRTDSSSIGDYESSCDEDEIEVNQSLINNTSITQNALANLPSSNYNTFIDLHSNLVASDDILLNTCFSNMSRSLSTNTLNSDVDGLCSQIDANNFDLTEFITKDDFQLQLVSKTNNLTTNEFASNITQSTSSGVNVLPSKTSDSDSDSDSDVIIDVETIEMDEDEATTLRKASEILKPFESPVQSPPEEESSSYIDNVKADPSWSPSITMKKVENHKVESNFSRNFPLVPNKKQCDMLRGKFGKAKGKGKAALKFIKPTSSKNSKMNNSPKNETPNANLISKSLINPENHTKEIGIGKGGKNLALLKHECASISDQSSEEDIPKKDEIIKEPSPQKQIQQQPHPIIKPVTLKQELKETPALRGQSTKRKLNLEEYKKRRNGDSIIPGTSGQTNAKFSSYKIPKLDNKSNAQTNNADEKSSINNKSNAVINNTYKKLSTNATSTKHSEAVTSIVKSLKEPQNVVQKTDPITEAKNKVLRMQELKKAKQMRLIDSTISAKVPKVTKLLPLREIVKDISSLNAEDKNSLSSQPSELLYEKIIIVSASCNTDISIPPIPNQATKSVNKASRSLLKSSALLSTISSTLQKNKATDNGKLSTNSLIASIQEVVVKNTVSVEETSNATLDEKKSKNPEDHGEDRIIIHLRKDTVRNHMCSTSTQTDLLSDFPSLTLPNVELQHKSRDRTRRKRKPKYRKHKTDQLNSSSSEYFSEDCDHSNSSTLSPSRDNSCSSLERMRTYDSAIGTGGSSRSSHRHRSSISSSYSEYADRVARGRRQRRTSYTKRSVAAYKRSSSKYSSSSCSSDRSRSPVYRRSHSRSTSRPRSSTSYRQRQDNINSNNFEDRNVSQPAVEERRIVYVGRIEQKTTKEMLKRKFSQYGTIEQISIHYKVTGMKYGFVTFERSKDAFNAIDNSTRDSEIKMYDVSFGGRRAFCRASYEDLDNAGINTYESIASPQPARQPKKEDSYAAELMKLQAKIKAKKTSNSSANTTGTSASSAATETQATNGQNTRNNKI